MRRQRKTHLISRPCDAANLRYEDRSADASFAAFTGDPSDHYDP